MSKDTEKTSETGRKVSRRELLKKTAMVVGGATAIGVTSGPALARPADVLIDSSGRVAIDGVLLPRNDNETKTARNTVKDKRCVDNGCINVCQRSRVKKK